MAAVATVAAVPAVAVVAVAGVIAVVLGSGWFTGSSILLRDNEMLPVRPFLE
ncbi:hypothetical protein [Corynebacterium propinquum]